MLNIFRWKRGWKGTDQQGQFAYTARDPKESAGVIGWNMRAVGPAHLIFPWRGRGKRAARFVILSNEALAVSQLTGESLISSG